MAPNNARVNTTYDAMGRVISRTNPFQSGGTPGPVTTIQYDLANRAVITMLPGGDIVRSDYSGSVVTATDQVNRKIKRETDGLGRLIKVTEQDSAGALTQETTYTYDLLDKLTGVNQGGQLRSYKYNAMGRLLFEKIPEQTATINDGTGTMWSCKYTYTEYSAVATKQDARGVVTTYGYDALHRPTSISYNTAGAPGVAATDNVTFIYDYDIQYGTSEPGKLLRVTMGGVEERYTYDDFGRVTSATESITPYSVPRSYTTSYEYNGGSQLSKLIYPSGKEVDVSYDDKGRFRELPGILSGVTYNLAGQVSGLQMTPSGGVSQSFGYDVNRLQLTTQTATKGATSLMNLTYGYQASAGQMGAGSTAGNAGQLMSISGTINSTTESAAYTYDNVGRLVTSNQTSNGSSAQRRFAYDRWGNRTGVWNATSGGNQIQVVALAQSGGVPTNQVSALSNPGWYGTYTYDAAGNVTWDGVHSYSYDAENRVVSVDNGATATYKYDHQNRRVSKAVGSSLTHYVWQGSQVIAEHDATTPLPPWWEPPYQVKSARVDYVYAGGKMVYSRQRTSSDPYAWTDRYYLSDRLSTRIVLDGSGNVLGRQGHLPFGEDFGETGSQDTHHFTSYQRDGEIGSDYAVNRQYSQNVGRYNRVDPYSGSFEPEHPQSLNRYNYVKGDSVNSVDPLGLFQFCVWLPTEGPDLKPYCWNIYQDPSGRPREFAPAGPGRCNVQVPTDPNIQAAVAVLLGEGTSEYRIGQQQYQEGDRPDHPTGETTITAGVLYAEMVEMVSVIANRARVGGFGGSTWKDVGSSGGFGGYKAGRDMLDEGQFGVNGSPLCERLRRAVQAANFVAQNGPTDPNALNWRGVVQGRGRHRFVRAQDGATRFGDTDFF